MQAKISFMGLDHRHPGDFVYGDAEHDWWLLVHTKTPAIFHLPTGSIETCKNTVILYPPKMFACYGATGDYYCNNYVRFYADDALEDFIKEKNIPLGSPLLLEAADSMEYLFRLLSMEDYFKFKNSAQSTTMIIRMMLMKISESVKDIDLTDQQRALLNLRYEIQLRPDYPWTVAEMAEKLHVSAGYLQSSYKKQFGVSCMQDVVLKRIELAKEHLRNSNYSSQRISQICGYQNVEHFCRQFKNITRESPLTYRKRMRAEKANEE